MQESKARTSTASAFTLRPHKSIPRCSAPLLVCVLDGWGESKCNDEYNAIYEANTPVMDGLKATQGVKRWRELRAHGTAVGLPSDGDMGNSEVGHNALGAGQIVDQGAKCVDNALLSGQLFQLPGWSYIEPAARSGTLHLIGLLSDGGVHSRYDQLMLLVNGAVQRGVTQIRLHVLSDGRDVEDGTASVWLDRLSGDLQEINARSKGLDARIASGGGRMLVTMDRYESDWQIVKRGWEAHVLGEASNRFVDPVEGVRTLQAKGGEFVSDQFIEPWVVVDGRTGEAVGPIMDGDAVVTFNFRADRMVEIAQALEYGPEQWTGKFDRRRWPDIKFAGMMQYDGELKLPAHYLVPPPVIERASEQYLVIGCGVRVFACSESQKIGHVTFFWNGNRSGTIDDELETFVEVPSDQGISFDRAPAMKAYEITQATKDAIHSGKYDFVRCNLANADMVGHTGNLKAAVEACTVVDRCVGELLEAVDAVGGRWLVTADHGNAEDMVQRSKRTGAPQFRKDGRPVPLTSHTLNPVPCAIGGSGLPAGVHFREDLPEAGLTNVTATFINLLGFEAPEFYEPTLIETD